MNPAAQSQDDQQNAQITSHLQDELDKLTQNKTQEEQKQKQEIEAKQKTQDKADGKLRPSLQSLLAQSGQAQTQASDDDQDKIVSSKDKEREEQVVGSPTPEHAPVQEIVAEFEPDAELAEFVKPTPDPQTITLPKPVEDEYGEILLQATQIPKPNITLPITEEDTKKGFHHKVGDSVRWLAEWCHYNIVKYPGRVFFKD